MPKTTPQGRGRNCSSANTQYLLDLIEEIEPCGSDEWTEISLKYNAHFGGRSGENRSGEDLKNKFKALKAMKKPTGDPSCPPAVRRAKNVQKSIEARMDVQDLDSGNEDEENNNYSRSGNDSETHFDDDNQTDDYENYEDDDRHEISRSIDFPTTSSVSSASIPYVPSESSVFPSASSGSSVFPSASSGSTARPSASLGSSSAIGRPPMPKRKAVPKVPSTTLRTGLTEDQLRSMTAAHRERSPSPQYSETVAKKRKIDSMLDRGAEILQGGKQSDDSLIHMIMLQNSQREARAEEMRREEREREERREERREREDREREDRREGRRREERIREEEARQDREERREEREREREERREKLDRERMEFMSKR